MPDSKGVILFCCLPEAKFSAWNLFKFTFYGKFGFSRRPDLDGNKLAKGMSWLEKKEIKKRLYLVVPRAINFFCFELSRRQMD